MDCKADLASLVSSINSVAKLNNFITEAAKLPTVNNTLSSIPQPTYTVQDAITTLMKRKSFYPTKNFTHNSSFRRGLRL